MHIILTSDVYLNETAGHFNDLQTFGNVSRVILSKPWASQLFQVDMKSCIWKQKSRFIGNFVKGTRSCESLD